MDNTSLKYEDQKRHFDAVKNQYSRDAIVDPPLHTKLELDGVVGKLVGIPAGDQVLDFGAGTGRLTIALARSGYSVLSIDISEPSLATLRYSAGASLHANFTTGVAIYRCCGGSPIAT